MQTLPSLSTNLSDRVLSPAPCLSTASREILITEAYLELRPKPSSVQYIHLVLNRINYTSGRMQTESE